MQLNLKKFDISTISNDSVVVFIGKRRTGKSFLVKDLLYYHQDLPLGTIISGTESANRFYGNIVPGMFIHDDYDPQIIENVFKRQKMIRRKLDKEEETKGKGNSNIDPRAFLILDDLMFDDTWIRDKNVRRLFFNGRHYFLTFLITMQYPLGIPPNLRTNVDYAFILRENNIQNRKKIYDNYAGMFPSFDMFCTCMDQCTENYECLVIKINASSNKLNDQVFWYKANSHEPFRLCTKNFWEAQAEHDKIARQKDDAEEQEDFFDTSSMKKKGPRLHVHKKS